MEISKTQFNSLYNDSTGGLFPTNTDQQIGSDDLRQQSEDIKDSVFFLRDNAYNGAKGTKIGVSTIAGLKAIATTSIETGVLVAFRDTGNGNVLRVYELVSGTDAESSPDTLRPDDYAETTNEKVWKLAVNFTYESKVVTAAGADTYTATLSPAISSYVTGAHYFVQFTNANTGAATLNLNSLGAKSIVKNGSAALEASDINAGQVYELFYDGTNLQILGRIGSGSGGGITNSAGNNELMKSNGTNAIGSGVYVVSGEMGIGVASPTAPLQFSGALVKRTLVLSSSADNEHQFNGIGRDSLGHTVFQAIDTSYDNIWYAGTSSTTSVELFRIKGNGHVIVPDYLSVGDTGTLVSKLTLRDDTTFANRFIELLHGSTSKHLTYFVEGTTTDGTTTTIQAVTAPSDSSFFVKASVLGVCVSGSGAIVGDSNGYELVGVFKNVGGSLLLSGSSVIASIEAGDVTWNAALLVDSGNIAVRVTGEASTTIRWTCKTEVMITTH